MTTPNPDTERSAVHGDPIARLREDLLRELRAEVGQQVRIVSMPPPPKSRLEQARESRWTPAAVAALIAALAPVVSVWLARDDSGLRTLQERAQTQEQTISELRGRVGELQDELDATQEHLRAWSDAVSAGLCARGVSAPGAWECRPGEYLPAPMNSSAPPVQIRARVPPMPN